MTVVRTCANPAGAGGPGPAVGCGRDVRGVDRACGQDVVQKQLGIAQSGRVALGELVAVPHLPSALSLDADVIGPGVVLAGGEKVVHGNVGEPFVLRLSQQQARLVPESATVTISYQGHEWQAVVAGTENDDVGDTLFHLRAPDGGPVCGVDCGSVSTGGEIFVRSRCRWFRRRAGPPCRWPRSRPTLTARRPFSSWTPPAPGPHAP